MKHVLRLTCGIGLIACSLSRVAVAEESSKSDSGELSEIVVTATWRETALQDVPAAITAFTAADLKDFNINDIRTLSAQTPGLVVAGPAGLGGTPVTIRGIGQLPAGIGADDPVAIYLDGVYLGRAYSDLFDFIATDRVEVLRGPQGTLYGRNATGGAISIVTRNPTDTVGGLADAQFTNLDSYRMRGLASGSLGLPGLSGEVAGAVSRKDGYVLNRFNGQFAEGERSQTLFTKLKYAPSAQFDATIEADANKRTIDIETKLLTETNTNPYSLAANFPGTEWHQSQGAALTVNARLPWATFTSITAYRMANFTQLYDSDSTDQEILRLDPVTEHENQISQEFRITSADSLALSWVAGVFYFRERAWSFGDLPFTSPVGVADLLLTANNTTNSYAGYVDGTWSITDVFRMTAGVRYTHESKDFLFAQTNEGLQEFATAPQTDSSISASAVTPRFLIDYKLNPSVMAYISANRGFKSGGFAAYNPLPTPTSTPLAFQPEHIWDYEAGLKSELFSHSLRMNFAAFYYDYTDLQVRTPDQYGFTVIRNAATANIKGLEAEFAWRPMSSIEINGNVSYLDARYKSFSYENGGVLVDLSGKRLFEAPEWKGALNAQYHIPLGEKGSLTLRGEYSYEGQAFYAYTNEPIYGHPALNLYNARVAYRTPSGANYITLFGENLSQKTYNTVVLQILGSPVGVPSPPRVFGVEIGTKF
jgi:iron complex outermembrane recepter protein